MVLMPVGDRNDAPRRGYPVVTVGLIAACILVFLWQSWLSPAAAERAAFGLGAIPAVITGHRLLAPALEQVPPLVSLLTSLFLHGDWMHLLGNMLFLWVFGDNIEEACGHLRFLAFYLACGVLASLVHVAVDPDSLAPVIGASGAISGVMGAYLVLHPRAQVILLAFFIILVRVPAVIVLSLWIAFQVFNGLMTSSGEGGGVAWWAHVGGFACGALLIVPFRRRGVPLFDRRRGTIPRHTLLAGRSVFPPSRRK